MARDLFGVPDEILLAEREKAELELMRGKSITATGDGSSSASQQIILHARSRIREINAELQARGHPEAPVEHTTPNDFVTVKF